MFKSLITIAALVASALALPTITSGPSTLQAGQSYPITWTVSTTATGPVSLLLKQGPSNNLQTVGTIASGLTGTSYTWTVPATYANGQYAIEIVQGTESNYWGPLAYTGGSGASVAASAAVSAPAVSAASSAAAASGSASAGSTKNMTSTMTTSKSSSSSSSTRSSATATATITSSNSAVALGSPIALILGAFAAMLYLQ